MYLVSACLAGVNCKYDGGNNEKEEIKRLVEEGKAILVCPEQLGGLPTPRLPSEIKGDKVFNIEGEEVTENFYRGAYETLKIAKMYKINEAIFKAKSPSCGCGEIYDGTFSGNLIDGNGITTRILKENGISVMTEHDFYKKIKNE
ncbi:Uncharacterized conserved protein YbbK, DUF523 family [Thermoanaerobacter thermohydrosulfuricus]|uniref:Uncharacterized protein n=4 Tax=Thermoanaerobacter TaxID=1754 RepID=G2MTN1_9THEO|nr:MULTISPECIES: DUF523 domain-containing protein [Thermoanaerobacter]EGD50949.1 protein of unknown function DUF523 [Thermoanaerobacter ethanolicus JW 200]HHY80957.1 DUF523 domain-containing protein [Thermoanaerobacter sp.]AEM79045.1 protein of unknown function DUF523 [Thermoanaerobacter wiegelii Rt8.B1]EMT38575.1 hypothetical protein TthWC1_1886 [Thermoanaerobacter thermohydrosulfuricus WC1]UZQ82115.1 DUF523 domain-containing protein [Thermoanaerobacter sp. RKWS2]